jgi:NitT/TauT family transport system substrate-binding protein
MKPTALSIVEGCAQSPRSDSCSWHVVVLGLIHRSRFTDTITMNARLASEIFLSSLQREFFSVLLVVAIVCVGSDQSSAADKIRISVTNFNMSFLPAGLAVKKGFFKEEGLEAEVIRMNANVAVAALASGDIDYTMIFGSVVRAAIRGLPVKVVASFIDGSTHALIARPEFKSVKELKGKTLGVQAYGATDHISAMMMLKHFGIDPEKEIKVLALGPASARLAALKEGVVEAAVISPPGDEEAKHLGFKIIARAYEVFTFPFVGLGTQVRKIKEKPDEVKRTIKALIKANRFIRQNRDGTIQALMEWGRTMPDLAAAAYDSSWKVFNMDGSIPDEGLRAVIEQAVKESKLTREVLASEVSDMTALREAQRELGIKVK